MAPVSWATQRAASASGRGAAGRSSGGALEVRSDRSRASPGVEPNSRRKGRSRLNLAGFHDPISGLFRQLLPTVETGEAP